MPHRTSGIVFYTKCIKERADHRVQTKRPKDNFSFKGKVKLSLCLTKHHAMKAYWSGGIAPRILDLGISGGEWSASRPG
jgi:hypothetical protein